MDLLQDIKPIISRYNQQHLQALELLNKEINHLKSNLVTANETISTLQIKNQELTQEMENYSKVSYIRQVSDQLTERNNYVSILENRILKLQQQNTPNETESTMNENISSTVSPPNISNEQDNSESESTAVVEKETILWDILEILQTEGIEILANSSLNISGDPTSFDLIDGLFCIKLSIKSLSSFSVDRSIFFILVNDSHCENE